MKISILKPKKIRKVGGTYQESESENDEGGNEDGMMIFP